MATLRDFFGDKKRGDGRKFTIKGAKWWFEPIFVAGENWYGIDEDDCHACWVNSGADNWLEYPQPKPKNKITLYRPIRLSGTTYFTSEIWHSSKEFFSHNNTVVAWEEREIEVNNV